MPSTLLTLLDDIATVLDDVAVLSKVAAKKTAGVLGDDLALNANQVAGVQPEREIPVVWAVCKGSFVNKLILVPAALMLSVWLPALVLPFLMLGGLYLCFEGAEKLAHRFLHSKEDLAKEHRDLILEMADNPDVDLAALEREKIKGAIRTDFILSAEIIVITLGTVADASLTTRILVLACVAIAMTVGVYGLVAGIVKIDDAGLRLNQRNEAWAKSIGAGLLWIAPRFMKMLSIVGTAAMFLVGGGILLHGIASAHHFAEDVIHAAEGVSFVGVILGPVSSMMINALVGVAAGMAAVALFEAGKKLRKVLGLKRQD